MSCVTLSSSVADISTPLDCPPARTFAPFDTASSINALTCRTFFMSTIAPSGVLPSRGSPAISVFAFAASFSANRSATLSTTTSRSVDMQICPELKKAPKAAAFTDSSRSASSSTTIGAFPPNSSRQGLRFCAARTATIRPTRVDPVKLMRLMAGWSINAPTTSPASSGALVTTPNKPLSRPPSAKASAMI